nr:immunoglobulin heavy chain junction region [Mus musculus]
CARWEPHWYFDVW